MAGGFHEHDGVDRKGGTLTDIFGRGQFSGTFGPPVVRVEHETTTNGHPSEVLTSGIMFAYDLDPLGGQELLKIPSLQ